MNQTKEKKTRYLLWPALLLLLLLLAPGNIVRVQAASDQTAVQLKLSQGIRRYDYAYQVLDLVNQERAKKNRNPVTMEPSGMRHDQSRRTDRLRQSYPSQWFHLFFSLSLF